MIIEKTIDGTFTYKGVVFEMLDYMAKALDIRYINYNYCKTKIKLTIILVMRRFL